MLLTSQEVDIGENYARNLGLPQGSNFIFGLGSTCATRCKFLGALAKF